VRKRFWIFFLFACGAIALRNPDWWLHPQFVAEDGKIFFAQQLVQGAHAVFVPSNGYLHLLPRLIAWSASPFPVVWQPLVFQVAGVIIAALCAAYFVLPECRFLLASDDLRMAVSALAIIDCHGEDLFANVAALQVFLFPVGLILLISNRSGPLRTVLIAVVALTAPALILFLPLAIWRYVRHQNLTASVYIVCAAIQIGVILTNARQVPHRPYPFWLPLVAAAESWVYRVGATLVIGVDWALFAGAKGGLGLAAVLAGAVLILLLWSQRRFCLKSPSNHVFWISIALGPALILEACLARQELLYFFQELNHFSLGGGARYFFMPACLFFLAAAILVERIRPHWRSEQQAGALVFLFLVGIHDNYPIAKYEDLHWASESEKIQAWKHTRTGSLQVRIPPTKQALWLIELP